MIQGEYYTFAEAAKLLGVTVARAHVLAKTYGLSVEQANPRFKLIPKTELEKIPSKRERKKLSGKRLDNR